MGAIASRESQGVVNIIKQHTVVVGDALRPPEPQQQWVRGGTA
jgi:hypothetical protein